MRQKFFHNIFFAGKGVVLILFLLAVFFGFGLVPKALAACNYTIVRFDPQGKTSATPSETLTFTVTVKKSGDEADCGRDTVRYRGQLREKNGWKNLDVRNTLNYTNAQASYNFSLNLGGYDRSNLPDINKMDFRLIIERDEYQSYPGAEMPVAIPVTIAQSDIWTVNITGMATMRGSVPVSIYFKPNQTTFQANTKFQVLVKVNDISKLDSSIQHVYYEFSVNGQKLGGFSKPRSAVIYDQYFDVTVNTANGFRDGTNDIQVILWQSDSSAKTGVKITEATATVQVAGISTTGNGTQPGNQPGTGQPGNQPGTAQPGNQPGTGNAGGSGVDCSGPNPDPKYCLYNPLPSSDLITMFMVITRWFLAIIAIVAVLFIIIGGFRMVIAQGNEEAYTKAKQTVTWAIIGVIVASLSFSIVSIVQNLLRTNVKTVDIQNK